MVLLRREMFPVFIQNPALLVVYRIAFVAMVFVGATVSLDVVWTFSDVMNGLMRSRT
ncbi:alanine:cation symporter family protein [Planococcus faecalis]|uniref:alanine:cation symporter family protein n=1 Tax=Planococcus faecalis TaxID=1598147 RepID=UPI0034E93294